MNCQSCSKYDNGGFFFCPDCGKIYAGTLDYREDKGWFFSGSTEASKSGADSQDRTK